MASDALLRFIDLSSPYGSHLPRSDGGEKKEKRSDSNGSNYLAQTKLRDCALDSAFDISYRTLHQACMPFTSEMYYARALAEPSTSNKHHLGVDDPIHQYFKVKCFRTL
jgi:hypothetical protein